VLEVGTTVARRYTIEAVAGTGGMCSVFRARDPSGTPVALKALHQAAAEAEERFALEVRMLQELHHPAIVRYLDSGTTESGSRFLVMEWLQGSDLENVLRTRRLTLGEILSLIGRIASALGAAHARGIVHRDVKPSNIFIVGEDVRQAKLLDFGVARWGGIGRSLTVTGTSIGTPAYMSPEQVRGERVIDARADVFALGCVMYECLLGEPAFVAHNPMAVFCKILVDKSPRIGELLPELPEQIDELVAAMLEKDPALRPRNGAEVAAAIETLAGRIDPDIISARADASRRSRVMLTTDEQRLVNVIVVGPRAEDAIEPLAGEANTVRLPRARTTTELTPTHRVSVHFDALRDGSMVALFEARGVATDQAMNAARFALAMRTEAPDADMALATGLAVVGPAKIVGEAIDRACQLLGTQTPEDAERAGPKPIRLDEVTAGLIGSRFDISRDGAGPILRGERPAMTERTLLGKPTPFVGRTRELAVLTSTLDECIQDSVARVVLVTGPAGSGKSRLLLELLRHVERRGGVEVWTAGGDPVRSGSALDLMSEAVRRLAGVRDDEPLELRRSKLHALAARHLPEARVALATEFLGELVGAPTATDESLPLRAARKDPLLMADQIRRAVEDLLDAHSADHPILLVLEDLHWGDQATLTLIDRVLRNLRERRLFIVALARPELHELFPRVWVAHNVTELRLGPLPRRAAQALAEAVLGPELPAERIAELVDRADGNPFYLEELVRTAAAGTWELPETVLAMVQARIEALEAESRRVLRAASVFGGLFWRGGLVALTGDGTSLDHWLEALTADELICDAEGAKFSGERAYRFRHDIVREAAYTLLTPEDKKLGHYLAGEWLDRVGETDARALAEHFERGAAPARALPQYLRAAETALERGDFAATLDLADRGEACGPEAADLGLLRALQGDARYWRGEYAETEQRYGDAMALLLRGSRRWYHCAGNLMIVWGARDATDLMETLARSLLADENPGADQLARLIALAVSAARLFLVGRRELAVTLLGRTESAAGEMAQPDAVLAAYIHRARACCALVDGDPSAFLVEMERGAARFEEIGDARETCFNRANVGYAELELGLAGLAERDLRAAIAVAEHLALDHVVFGARSNLGMALARQGRLRDACALEQRCAEWFEQQRDWRLAGASRMYMAIALFHDGELVRAEQEARAALAIMTARTRGRGLATLARVLLARGAAAEALEHATVAEQQLGETPAVEGEGEVRLVYAEALHANGHTERARVAITGARARLEERARRIKRDDWRQSFLENIPAHARTLVLAQEWSAGASLDPTP
jgi:tetratricopeptide (TPR) repeat protein